VCFDYDKESSFPPPVIIIQLGNNAYLLQFTSLEGYAINKSKLKTFSMPGKVLELSEVF
jgi:hypothetical protein